MSEQDIHIDCVDWLSLALDARDSWFWFTPNGSTTGGKRGQVQGALQKKMGMRNGYPDLTIAHAEFTTSSNGTAVPIGVEIKSATGRQSDAQKAAQKRFEAFGWPYRVVRDVSELEDFLRELGVPLRTKRFDFGGGV